VKNRYGARGARRGLKKNGVPGESEGSIVGAKGQPGHSLKSKHVATSAKLTKVISEPDDCLCREIIRSFKQGKKGRKELGKKET